MRVATSVAMSGLLVGACRAPARTGASAPPKDEVWLREDEATAMQLATEEVKLEEVEQTVIAVGQVLSSDECAVKDAGAREACVVAAVDLDALGDGPRRDGRDGADRRSWCTRGSPGGWRGSPERSIAPAAR